MKTIPLYDLKNQKEAQEVVYGGALLSFAYSFFLLRFLISIPWVQKKISQYVGIKKKSPQSKKDIAPFIKHYQINIDEFVVPAEGFKSFNDFFIRQKKNISFPEDKNIFASPCDARLMVSRIENNVPALKVKGRDVPLPQLMGSLAHLGPKSGWALTFRLCPVDYHRFHFVDSGKVGEVSKLGKHLHSVNPWALAQLPKIFEINERQLCQQDTDSFGKITYIEVGAMCVGLIHQSFSPNERVLRGQEKGYFDFGASTLVLLVEDSATGHLEINPQILEKNNEGLEVLTHLGDNLGRWRPPS
jgi:phosphatidylserine decarboxylase